MAAYLDTDTMAELALQSDAVEDNAPQVEDDYDEFIDALVSEFVNDCELRAEEAWMNNPTSWEPLD